MTSIEQRCADFLLNYCKGPLYSEYRVECFRFWRQVYGDETVRKIRAIVAGKVNK